MVASLGAIAFLITSDVAVAEEASVARPPPAQTRVAVRTEVPEQAQVQAPEPEQTAKPAPKAKAKSRRKRIDLGRFEGY